MSCLLACCCLFFSVVILNVLSAGLLLFVVSPLAACKKTRCSPSSDFCVLWLYARECVLKDTVKNPAALHINFYIKCSNSAVPARTSLGQGEKEKKRKKHQQKTAHTHTHTHTLYHTHTHTHTVPHTHTHTRTHARTHAHIARVSTATVYSAQKTHCC